MRMLLGEGKTRKKENTHVTLFRNVFRQTAPEYTEAETTDYSDGSLKNLIPKSVVREHDALYDAVYCDRRSIVDSGYSYDQRRNTLKKKEKQQL